MRAKPLTGATFAGMTLGTTVALLAAYCTLQGRHALSLVLAS